MTLATDGGMFRYLMAGGVTIALFAFSPSAPSLVWLLSMEPPILSVVAVHSSAAVAGAEFAVPVSSRRRTSAYP